MKKVNFLLLCFLFIVSLIGCNHIIREKFYTAQETFLDNLQKELVKIDPQAKIGIMTHKGSGRKQFSVIGYHFYVKQLLEKSQAKNLLLKYTDCFLTVLNSDNHMMAFIDKDTATFKDLHLILKFEDPKTKAIPKRPYIQYIVLMNSTIYYYYYDEQLNDVAFKDLEIEPFPLQSIR